MTSIKIILKKIYYFFVGYKSTKNLLESSLKSSSWKPNIYLYNIWSYCQNEFMVKNDKELLNSERYEYFKKIHNLLKIEELVNGSLERVGHDTDGGYIMARNGRGWTYSREKIAYSLGIGADVAWDKHMAEGGVSGVSI